MKIAELVRDEENLAGRVCHRKFDPFSVYVIEEHNRESDRAIIRYYTNGLVVKVSLEDINNDEEAESYEIAEALNWANEFAIIESNQMSRCSGNPFYN